MSDAGELQRLEVFVGKLLAEFKDLQKELAEKKAVIEELNDQLAMQQLEREEVADRVTRIVTQFESWERELAEEEVADEAASADATGDDYGQKANLYSGQ